MDHPSVSTVLFKMFHATVIIPIINAMLYVTLVQLAKAQVPLEYQPLMPKETAPVKIGIFTQASSFKSFFFQIFLKFREKSQSSRENPREISYPKYV